MTDASSSLAAGRPARPTTVSIARLALLWVARFRQRRRLAELDARLRADLGLSIADIDQEAAKPFWRP